MGKIFSQADYVLYIKGFKIEIGVETTFFCQKCWHISKPILSGHDLLSRNDCYTIGSGSWIIFSPQTWLKIFSHSHGALKDLSSTRVNSKLIRIPLSVLVTGKKLFKSGFQDTAVCRAMKKRTSSFKEDSTLSS